MSMTATIQAAALAYYDGGASVIPITTEPSKKPLLPSWDEFKLKRTSREQTEVWFRLNNRAIGVICGAVSGNREGIDIDNRPRAGYPDAEELINQMASMVDAEDATLWDRLAIESSPRRGWHLLYRCTAVEGNLKLAMRPATDEDRIEADNPKLDRVTIIETRGEGGYFVSAPSPGYEVYQNDPANPPEITPDERAILFRAARALNLLQETPEPPVTHTTSSPSGSRPGDLYNAVMSADAVTTLLVAAGWHRCMTRRDGVIILRRPGKKEGWSATVGYGGTNLLRVFSSNGYPFEPDKSYPPFSVRTLLEFNGDFEAATAALVDEGHFVYEPQSGPMRSKTPAKAAPDVPYQKMPLLPDVATAVYKHVEPCGLWLDRYVAYAQQVSLTMVPTFHVAAGLFAVSTAIARRVRYNYRAGMLYPNLYALFVAPSGYGKTTSFGALESLMQAVGINHLLLTKEMTPENLLAQLSNNLPSTLSNWEPIAQAAWLRERAFAAQRGWMIDESAFLFDSLAREYMSGLMGLILKFYDCPAYASRETQSGGRVMIKDVSLAFFGASTTSNMRPHFQNEKWWSDGLWGRFAIILPERAPIWINDDEAVPIPVPIDVVQGLRRVYTMFGEPSAELVEDDKHHKTIEITGSRDPVDIALAPGVYTAWQVYRKTMAFDIGTSAALDEPLRGSYSRFATHAMKVAMLLAVMDAPDPNVIVTLAHYARGQQIAEGWRACMHQIWSQEMRIDERQLGDRALVKLRAVKPAGLTARQIQQQLNRTAREINDVLMLLQESGMVSSGKEGKKTVWIAE